MNNQHGKTIEAFNAKEPTFADLVRSGKCTINDIDIYIDKWHDEYKGPLKLHEYLGLTRAQYGKWLVNRHSLHIPVNRKQPVVQSASIRNTIVAELNRLAEDILSDSPSKN